MGQYCCSSVNAGEVDAATPQHLGERTPGTSSKADTASFLPEKSPGRVSSARALPTSRASSASALPTPMTAASSPPWLRSVSAFTARTIVLEDYDSKPLDELLQDFERNVVEVQAHYISLLRHPDSSQETLQKANATMRKLSQYSRRTRMRAAHSWQDGDEGDAKEWVNLLLGHRNKRFRSMKDVVKQVQLETRIIRKWKSHEGSQSGSMPSSMGLMRDSKVQIEAWEEVDIFRLEQDTQQPLVHIFMSIWEGRSLSKLSKATSEQVLEFMRAVEATYRTNLYHNRSHAAEVTYTAYYLWAQLDAQDHMRGYFSAADLLALIVAGAIHDMAHPGMGNDFLVKTQHALALRYSDRSVLEHYHIASAFALIKEMNVPLLEHGLPSPPPETLKGRVVDMVLATDMAQHRRVVDDINAEMAVHQAQDIDKLVLEPLLLHLADIGHPLRVRGVHKEWSTLIREEMFQQGDQEKKLGLNPLPLCDREKAPTLAKSQQGFLSFVVMPSWRPMGQALGSSAGKQLEAYLTDNMAMWEEMASEDREREECEREEKENEVLTAGGGLTPKSRLPPSPCRKRGTTIF